MSANAHDLGVVEKLHMLQQNVQVAKKKCCVLKKHLPAKCAVTPHATVQRRQCLRPTQSFQPRIRCPMSTAPLAICAEKTLKIIIFGILTTNA